MFWRNALAGVVHFGRHSLLPGHGLADGFHQEIGVGVFQNIAARAQLEAFFQVVGIFGNGEHQHRQPGLEIQHLSQGFGAVHHRHFHVEQHQIGAVEAGKLHALEAVGGFGNDFKTVFLREQKTEPTPEQGVVVYQEDADVGFGHGAT